MNGLIFFLFLMIGFLLVVIAVLFRKNSMIKKKYDQQEEQLKEILNLRDDSEKLKKLEEKLNEAFYAIKEIVSAKKDNVESLQSFKDVMINKFVWPKALHDKREYIMNDLFANILNVIEHLEVDKVLIECLQDKINNFRRELQKIFPHLEGEPTNFIRIEFLRLAMVTFDVVEYLGGNSRFNMEYQGLNLNKILQSIDTKSMSLEDKDKIQKLKNILSNTEVKKVSKDMSNKQEAWAFVMNKILTGWQLKLPSNSEPLIYAGYKFVNCYEETK